MAQSIRRLIHAAILAVVVLLFSVTAQQALAALTASQTAHTLAFLQGFPKKISTLTTSWTGTDYCSWDGISCDASGYVTVSLSGKGLSGKMPQIDNDIDGSQVMVVSIDLSNNPSITDGFQDSWARLLHLTYLDLSSTSLRGAIPDAWNGMRSLETVKISNTYACKGLPNWSIASLRNVDMSNNNLFGSLSYSWGTMTGLSSVDITGNSFCGCVPTTWKSAVLRNAASAAGGAMTTSTCATTNYCTQNSYNYCPSSKGTTSSPATSTPDTSVSPTLRFLQRFPREISYLSSRWTGTDYCNWEGISCDASGYVSINLSGKGLDGRMPSMDDDTDGEQVMVVSIDMSNNMKLSGNFQDSWARLKNLGHLDLSSTNLRGDIPDAWNGMTALESVKISNTLACRNLPNWNIASLRTVDLSKNKMGGRLVNSWGSMTELSSVDITGNSFCGCVPSTWTSSVLKNAAAAIGGNLVSVNCGTSNQCGNNAGNCPNSRNAAAAPVQLTMVVAASLMAAVAALSL